MDLAELLGHEAVEDGDQLLAWARSRAAELVEALDPDDPLGALLVAGASPTALDEELDGVPVSRRRRREPSSPQPKTADELPPPPEHPGLADGEPEPVLETVDTGPIDLEEEIVRRRMREDSWALASTTRELDRVVERMAEGQREVAEVVETTPTNEAPASTPDLQPAGEALESAADAPESAVEAPESAGEATQHAVQTEPAGEATQSAVETVAAEPSIEIDVASEPSIEIDVDVDLAADVDAGEGEQADAVHVDTVSVDTVKVELPSAPVDHAEHPARVEASAGREPAAAPETGDLPTPEIAAVEAEGAALEPSDEPEAAQPRAVETSAPELPVVVGPAQPSELDFVEPAGLDLAAIDVPESSTAAAGNDEEFELDDLDELEVEEVELDEFDEPEDEPAKPSAGPPGPPGKAPPKPPPPKPPPRKDATPHEDAADLVSELIRTSGESKTTKLDELDGSPAEPE